MSSKELTIIVSPQLVHLLTGISEIQANNIGSDCKELYQNYYLDLEPHLQALYQVGLGLGIQPDHKVLEIGSGIGTRCLLGTGIFGSRFTGLEPCVNAYSMLGKAITEFKDSNSHIDYCYVNRSGEDTGLESEMYDIILSFEVMEHVNDPNQVVKEMYRLLKPGGKVFISTCNYDSFYEGHYRCLWLPFLSRRLTGAYIGWRGYNRQFLNEVNFLTKKKLMGYLIETGFRNILSGYRYSNFPLPELQLHYPEGYTPLGVRRRKSFASMLVENPLFNIFLSRLGREYKIYIEAQK